MLMTSTKNQIECQIDSKFNLTSIIEESKEHLSYIPSKIPSNDDVFQTSLTPANTSAFAIPQLIRFEEEEEEDDQKMHTKDSIQDLSAQEIHKEMEKMMQHMHSNIQQSVIDVHLNPTLLTILPPQLRSSSISGVSDERVVLLKEILDDINSTISNLYRDLHQMYRRSKSKTVQNKLKGFQDSVTSIQDNIEILQHSMVSMDADFIEYDSQIKTFRNEIFRLKDSIQFKNRERTKLQNTIHRLTAMLPQSQSINIFDDVSAEVDDLKVDNDMKVQCAENKKSSVSFIDGEIVDVECMNSYSFVYDSHSKKMELENINTGSVFYNFTTRDDDKDENWLDSVLSFLNLKNVFCGAD